jgi:hypothetical protein
MAAVQRAGGCRTQTALSDEGFDQVIFRGTANGAGAEIVGSHTVMSRDDQQVPPCIEEPPAVRRQCLRFPVHQPGGRETVTLSSRGALEPPLPAVHMLGPDFGADALKARREGKPAAELEARFRALEALVDQ